MLCGFTQSTMLHFTSAYQIKDLGITVYHVHVQQTDVDMMFKKSYRNSGLLMSLNLSRSYEVSIQFDCPYWTGVYVSEIWFPFHRCHVDKLDGSTVLYK